MHIKDIHLKGFKRFTDLTITGIPVEAKLILLAGPNGTGKSTIFEGLNVWRRLKGDFGGAGDVPYFAKLGGSEVNYQDYVTVGFHEGAPPDHRAVRKSIWVRSAYRHDPDFALSSLQKQTPLLDDGGLARLIEAERSVAVNYQRLVASTVASVYDETLGGLQVDELRLRLIGRLQSLVSAVFGDLTLEGPGNPLADGTFFFTKGVSKNFRYLNLSAGEKAAFDLLLDLVLRIEEYDDTVFCLDEPELHIGTRTQALLLNALVGVLSDRSQLWLATHSIGMMRAARDLERAYPGTVCFLDTADHDYDTTIVLRPSTPNRAFWRKALTVALDDLAELVAPATVVICEGHPTDEWDARCFRAIFAAEFPDVEFLSVGNAHDVQGDRAQIGAAVTTLVPGTSVIRVRDRDEMTQTEVDDVEAQGCHVLSRRHLESYLLSDDALLALAAALGDASKGPLLVAAREAALATAVSERGKSPDDFKSVGGAVYNEVKAQFHIAGQGSKATAFLAEVVAPVLTPGMKSYDDLRHDIFR